MTRDYNGIRRIVDGCFMQSSKLVNFVKCVSSSQKHSMMRLDEANKDIIPSDRLVITRRFRNLCMEFSISNSCT